MSIDQAGAIRDGEELDLDLLGPWMSQNLPHLQGRPEVTQYTGGASNWTYRLKYDNDDLILRRPPMGTKAKGAHDMGREFRLQQALQPVFSYVPTMHAYCEDSAIIGDEFYVMERLNGIIPRKNLPRDVSLSPDEVRTLCTNVLDTLIALHKVDHVAAGLDTLAAGAGYTQRQIAGWSKRYRDARTWNVPRGEGIMRWLEANVPENEHLCLTHNDFRFDNVVLDPSEPTRVIGVLDWELATIGDPLMDLGNTLAYWVEAGDDRLARATRRQPTTLPGMLTRDEVIAYYCDAMDLRPESFTFYQVYGLFRLSGIVQQIYARYYKGQTKNPEYKRFWVFVHYLHHRCRKLIRKAS
ncbi:phosphotransferase family protein [Loktanella sp. F6476L]|uniref:phosphotransferase family protein n=1 Tax=Loktanella sp. F6476L TaxID=2926405 RepID=UPI001FF25A85|nr:phosphotransferase family protein [Loktanella sp. F6476L]MCK0122170.1 phosphotransferase family protein [Loktanella sp. F6476L]